MSSTSIKPTSAVEEPHHWTTYPAILVLMAAALGVSGAPAPLYGVYAATWHFAPITTTLVFSVYAVCALVSVLLAGPVSDRIGRRPVLLGAALGLLVGLAVFMAAQNVYWLLVARAIHGLSVGAIVVAGSAALLDIQPSEGARSGKRSGVAFNAGIGSAVLTSAVLAQYGPFKLVLPFAVLTVLIASLLLAIIAMKEPHRGVRPAQLRIARPHVPSEISREFRFAAVGVVAAWSVLGVFLSLFPTIAELAVGSHNLVFGGGVVAASAFAAALSQLIGVRWAPRVGAIVGDIGTAVALLAAVLAVNSSTEWAIALASAALGFFFGLAFGSSLRFLGDIVPADKRGEVMSAFYLYAYCGMAIPTILAGWAATVWSPQVIFAPFMVLVALGSLGAALMGWTIRRR
jgi:MFS family permease